MYKNKWLVFSKSYWRLKMKNQKKSKRSYILLNIVKYIRYCNIISMNIGQKWILSTILSVNYRLILNLMYI